jgi:hypothetical protein
MSSKLDHCVVQLGGPVLAGELGDQVLPNSPGTKAQSSRDRFSATRMSINWNETIMNTMTPNQPCSQGVVQFDRVGVAAVDADASNIQLLSCQGMSVATVAAVCDTASATLKVRMIYYNNSGIPCGSSLPVTFTSGPVADYGGLYMGVPDSDIWRPVAGATSIGIKVDSVSAGRWSIHGAAG